MHRLRSAAAAGIPVQRLPFRGAPVPRLPLSPSPAPSHSITLSPYRPNFALPSLLFPLQGSRWPPSGLCCAQRPITGMLMCLSFPSAHRSSPATCISKGTLTRAARIAQSLQWPAVRCDGVSMPSGNARHHLTSSGITWHYLAHFQQHCFIALHAASNTSCCHPLCLPVSVALCYEWRPCRLLGNQCGGDQAVYQCSAVQGRAV